LKRRILEQLQKIESINDLIGLFKLLNYPVDGVIDVLSEGMTGDLNFKKDDAKRIKKLHAILVFDNKLPVFLLEVKTLATPFIRSVASGIDKKYEHFMLVFSIDYSGMMFLHSRREPSASGDYWLKLMKLIIKKDRLINKNEQHAIIEALSSIYFNDDDKWHDVLEKWGKAFSAERVNKAFFEDYKRIFFVLKNEFLGQKTPKLYAHKLALQFLNRIMVIYFISETKWNGIGNVVELSWFSYKSQDKFGSDEFYSKWLVQIFFKAFNGRSNEISRLPGNVMDAICNYPFLECGLFNKNELDELEFKISDAMFEQVFDFFQRYNFTVKEATPFESEVAVDPRMIGHVYELLAIKSGETLDRCSLGVFYTPMIEVDFLCRQVMVEYLSKHLEVVPKEKIYHLVFDQPGQKDDIESWFDEQHLWNRLEAVLDDLFAVDPACGSGEFLIGLLAVLTELYKIVYKHERKYVSGYELKRKIIQHSLYGVDVMPWAIHAAELRLWLQLFDDDLLTDDGSMNHLVYHSINLNLRVGDSLVPGMGEMDFNLRKARLVGDLKSKIVELRKEKKWYKENSPVAKFKNIYEVNLAEARLFSEIVEKEIRFIKKKIKGEVSLQTTLDGSILFMTKKNRFKDLEKRLQDLNDINESMSEPGKRPFIWCIDFAEVFGDKDGFDIVIGNPPYVRQEVISPPSERDHDVTRVEKMEYKERLVQSVKNLFPRAGRINKKSDYYIYFYFHGLGLLNSKGTLCFITSNSWLDVDYGKELQEFLCKHVPIIAIYDYQRRSFAHADINTVITLFGAPRFKKEQKYGGTAADLCVDYAMLMNTAKFVMFKKPFSEVINTKNLVEIDNIELDFEVGTVLGSSKKVITTSDYRVFLAKQGELLADGWNYPDGYNIRNLGFDCGKYTGNKWGAKFLRAPDIFFTVLEKGKDKLVELGSVARVSRGFTTGLNDFFYLPSKYFDLKEQGNYYELIPKRDGLPRDIKIEKEFLKPVIKSPKDFKTIRIEPSSAKYKLFFCDKSRSKLGDKKVLDYIIWGERQRKTNGHLWKSTSTVQNRTNWYSLNKKEASQLNFNYLINEYGITYFGRIHASDNFHQINTSEDLDLFLNSTVFWLFQNVIGRTSFGGGLLKIQVYELRKMPVMIIKDNGDLRQIYNREATSIFTELGLDPSKPFQDQDPMPLSDRAVLDKAVFDELNLSDDERKEVYWSLAELVKQRLSKAKIINK